MEVNEAEDTKRPLDKMPQTYSSPYATSLVLQQQLDVSYARLPRAGKCT